VQHYARKPLSERWCKLEETLAVFLSVQVRQLQTYLKGIRQTNYIFPVGTSI
jgi:hypothetical protein